MDTEQELKDAGRWIAGPVSLDVARQRDIDAIDPRAQEGNSWLRGYSDRVAGKGKNPSVAPDEAAYQRGYANADTRLSPED